MDRTGDQIYLQDEAEDGFSFEDMLRILRRHWRIILSVTLTAAAIAIQLSLLMPNTYEAVARVQVDERRKQIVDIDSVIDKISATTPAVESEVEILTSSTLALRVIDRLKLREDPEFAPQESRFAFIYRMFGANPAEAANAEPDPNALHSVKPAGPTTSVRTPPEVEFR
ncbi:MAG: Wzz/FepE/Etk N-terminal domain-containing protein [Pseudomonadota bacterium]